MIRRTGLPALILLALPAIALAVHLSTGPEVDHRALGIKVLALFLVIFLGLLLGRIQVFGVSLGTAGVLFTALTCGYLGYELPGGVGHLGLVLFVYCVGLTAGPTIFRAFGQTGRHLALLSLLMVSTGTLTAWIVTRALEIPVDLAAGVFAGGMSSTPALAADNQALAEAGSRASIGFGLTYLFGAVGVVLAMQILPRILKTDLDRLSSSLQDGESGADNIERALVRVANPGIFGKEPSDTEPLKQLNCAITHQLKEDRMAPIEAGFRFAPDQVLWLSSRRADLDAAITVIGTPAEITFTVDTLNEQREIVITSPQMLSRPFGSLKLLNRFGVTVSLVSRHGQKFVPHADVALQYGDVLTVSGSTPALQRFAGAAGHRPRATEETDLVSLSAGISLGVLVGMIPFPFPGGGVLELGLAGGPLLIALLLGHFGKVGPITGHMPQASRFLLNQLGLVFFLASAGAGAGAYLVDVMQQFGPSLLAAGAIVTVVPLLLGFLVAHFFMKLNLLETMGALCGGMTSTPGMGAVTSQTDSDVAVVSYATAYPIALLFTVAAAQLLVLAMGG